MATAEPLTANLTERTDPASIHPAVQDFLHAFRRRFERLHGLVRQTVEKNDALHLQSGPPAGVHGVRPFTGTPEAVENFPASESAAKAAFGTWFLNAVRQAILGPTSEEQVKQGAHWTAPFIDSAFVQGVTQSTGQLQNAGVSMDRMEPGEILTDGGFEPALRTRYWSAYSELDGISEDMARSIRGVLGEAFDEGWNPKKAADVMVEEIGRIDPETGEATMHAARAKTLSRTELMFAHTNSSLRNYARGGVTTVGHVGRMITPDSKVCGFCRRLADESFTLREFAGTRVLWRGQRYFVGVPSHPNGRCSPIPKPGVDPGDLPPIEERVPGTVIAEGLNIYDDPLLA